jgi:hypothetical protein
MHFADEQGVYRLTRNAVAERNAMQYGYLFVGSLVQAASQVEKG